MNSFNSVAFKNWYRLFHQSLFKDLDFDLHYVANFFDHDPYYRISNEGTGLVNAKNSILFFDQEPIHPELICRAHSAKEWYFTPGQRLFVTSERSTVVDRYTQGMNAQSIYYFFHAIAANEWYRGYRWDRPTLDTEHKHLFVSYNNLVTPYRAHRVDLMCRLYSRRLENQGLVSFNFPNPEYLTGVVNECPWYSEKSKTIFNMFKKKLVPRTIDTTEIVGTLSASIDLVGARSAFVQVVTETDYYKDKIHLTEKVFKPIVAGQPFLLLAGPGNLAYLREYGFKTFGDYWDESYDSIVDPGERMAAVVDILEQLSNLTHTQQCNMRKDMQAIILHNFDHLFSTMRPMVVDELTTNIKTALDAYDINVNLEALRTLNRILVN